MNRTEIRKRYRIRENWIINQFQERERNRERRNKKRIDRKRKRKEGNVRPIIFLGPMRAD